MNIDKLKRATAALNEKLSEAARGQNQATVNLLKAQIEFNNAAVVITGMQQQMEKLEAAQQDRQAARPS